MSTSVLTRITPSVPSDIQEHGSTVTVSINSSQEICNTIHSFWREKFEGEEGDPRFYLFLDSFMKRNVLGFLPERFPDITLGITFVEESVAAEIAGD